MEWSFQHDAVVPHQIPVIRSENDHGVAVRAAGSQRVHDHPDAVIDVRDHPVSQGDHLLHFAGGGGEEARPIELGFSVSPLLHQPALVRWFAIHGHGLGDRDVFRPVHVPVAPWWRPGVVRVRE